MHKPPDGLPLSHAAAGGVGWSRWLGSIYLALILRCAITANVFFMPDALPIG